MTKEGATRGRPRKPKSERAPTVNFTMRLRPSLLDELRKSAEAGERSITAEAESRLSQPPVHEVGKMVSLVVEAIERREGATYKESNDVREQCRAAADYTLDLLLGARVDEQMTRWELEREMERRERVRKGEPPRAGLLNSLLGVDEQLMSLDALQTKLNSLERIQKGKKSAAETPGVHERELKK